MISAKRKTIPVLALGAILLLGAPCQGSWLSENLEKLYGSYVKIMLEAQIPVEKDPMLNAIVRDMFDELVVVGGRTNLEHRIRILDTDMVNAMAAPGGYIWVTKGMLRYVDTPDELAAVLGHEVAHVSHRHGWENLKRDFAVDLLLTALQATRFGGYTGWASALYYIQTLNYSREDEMQADRSGATFSQGAGWDNTRMRDFFLRLHEESGHISKFDIFFSTHPSYKQRMSQLEELPEFRFGDPAVLTRIGDNYAGRFLFNLAAEKYDEALAVDADYAPAHSHLAATCSFLGMHDRAEGALARAGELNGGPGLSQTEDDRLIRDIVAMLEESHLEGRLTVDVESLDVAPALAALEQAEAQIQEASVLLEHHDEEIEDEREELDHTLDHVIKLINSHAETGAASVHGWTALASAADTVSMVTESVVASDEVASLGRRVVEEHHASNELLRRVLTTPELLAKAPVAIELAARAPQAAAQATTEMDEALDRARDALDDAQAAAMSIGANMGALRRALVGAGGAQHATQLFDRHYMNVLSAVRNTKKAQETGAKAAVRSAETEIALDLALADVITGKVLEATLSRFLRTEPEMLAQARQATDNFGEIIMICAAAIHLKSDVSAVVEGLNGAESVVDGLADMGVDMDNLHIVMHMVAGTLRYEREAALRLRGLDATTPPLGEDAQSVAELPAG